MFAGGFLLRLKFLMTSKPVNPPPASMKTYLLSDVKYSADTNESPYCTVTSHISGNFFDLRPLVKLHPGSGLDWTLKSGTSGNLGTSDETEYPKANFSLNICAPLLNPVISGSTGDAIAASVKYADGTVKSLGICSPYPHLRGRNLLLEYTDGSPCLNPDGSPTKLLMSALISFKCDHSLASNHAVFSFIGSPDHCSHFFEARTLHACPSINQSQSMTPISIFIIIFLVALVVYIAGSVVVFTPSSLTWTRIKDSPLLLLKSISTSSANYYRMGTAYTPPSPRHRKSSSLPINPCDVLEHHIESQTSPLHQISSV